MGWISRTTRRLDAFSERTVIATAAVKVERDVRRRVRETASKRSAISVIFGNLLPDGRPASGAVDLAVAKVLSAQSDCTQCVAGVVIVKDGQPLSWGWVGSNPGDSGCISASGPDADHDGSCCVHHAVIGAIDSAICRDVSLYGSTMYLSGDPCLACIEAARGAEILQIICETSEGRLTGLTEM